MVAILCSASSRRTVNPRRAGDFEGAHRLFLRIGAGGATSARTVHEFAQTKMQLAKAAGGRDQHPERWEAKRRLNQETAELLRRASTLSRLSQDQTREAWCWFNLAETLQWLGDTASEIEVAYRAALTLLPTESRFHAARERWRDRARR